MDKPDPKKIDPDLPDIEQKPGNFPPKPDVRPTPPEGKDDPGDQSAASMWEI